MKEIRITTTKTVEYIEEYAVPFDEFKTMLVKSGKYEFNDDNDIEIIARTLCENEELEDYIMKSPNGDIDMTITVEDSYILKD